MIFAVMIANVAAFVTMFSAIRGFVLVVTIPKHVLLPIILMMCVVGAYKINHGIMLDVWTLLIFGLFGWLAGHGGDGGPAGGGESGDSLARIERRFQSIVRDAAPDT